MFFGKDRPWSEGSRYADPGIKSPPATSLLQGGKDEFNGPRGILALNELAPRHFRDTSETLPRHFLDTS